MEKTVPVIVWILQYSKATSYICMQCLTTSNIILIGFLTKATGSGGGSIWSEKMGEPGTSGAEDL